ncbi:hypothetical protein DLAC_01404 [Tieghemostelium lacteum]|uniref:Uncharacterized protein n=1 Tax=Tieghemostelium lacteum TaxID=361077 RepID=A0A152A6P7_TIELA|nr:hypothetical protein DLAC_01404 [Tieghemostelium lacteum]|eukprot:KYR01900.1 hypothetical protein DLAC_01404 [Tieghemostelium lacteum]
MLKYIIFIILLQFIVRIYSSDGDCIIGNLQADKCQDNIYEFTTSNTTIIDGDLIIPLGYYLKFNGPVVFSRYSNITMNCKPVINSPSYSCVQIETEDLMSFYTTHFNINMDLSQVTKPMNSSESFFLYQNVNSNNNDDKYTKPLFYINFITEKSLNAYFYVFDDTYIQYYLTNESVTFPLDLNITNNCEYITIDVTQTILNNIPQLAITQIYYYQYTDSVSATRNYIYLRIYSGLTSFNESSIIRLFNSTFLNQYCISNSPSIHVYIVNPFPFIKNINTVMPTSTPTKTPTLTDTTTTGVPITSTVTRMSSSTISNNNIQQNVSSSSYLEISLLKILLFILVVVL